MTLTRRGLLSLIPTLPLLRLPGLTPSPRPQAEDFTHAEQDVVDALRGIVQHKPKLMSIGISNLYWPIWERNVYLEFSYFKLTERRPDYPWGFVQFPLEFRLTLSYPLAYVLGLPGKYPAVVGSDKKVWRWGAGEPHHITDEEYDAMFRFAEMNQALGYSVFPTSVRSFPVRSS